jgi:hypothetical protein
VQVLIPAVTANVDWRPADVTVGHDAGAGNSPPPGASTLLAVWV